MSDSAPPRRAASADAADYDDQVKDGDGDAASAATAAAAADDEIKGGDGDAANSAAAAAADDEVKDSEGGSQGSE